MPRAGTWPDVDDVPKVGLACERSTELAVM
jgi:hypothetical protein